MTDNCTNLCTKAECQALEARISALEQALELLESSFEAHTKQHIPEAHYYLPNVYIGASYLNKQLTIGIRVDGQSDNTVVEVDPHVESNLKIDGSYQSGQLQLTIADGESQDTAEIPININDTLDVDLYLNSENQLNVTVQLGDQFASDSEDLPKYEPFVTVDVFEQEANRFVVKVQVDGDSDEDDFYLDSNLKINGSFADQKLQLTIADGNSQDTATIPINIEQDVNYFIDNYYTNNYSGGNNVNCDNLLEKFEECCTQILNAINNVEDPYIAPLIEYFKCGNVINDEHTLDQKKCYVHQADDDEERNGVKSKPFLQKLLSVFAKPFSHFSFAK